MTSAGLALPLLGAGAAQAATGETWDAVATCESDGAWSADTGNGYYGGLQLPLSLWEEFGGKEFADRPDLASRSQQIEVAERILAEQGLRAFPSCSLGTGLSQEHRAARAGTVEEHAEESAAGVEPGGSGGTDGTTGAEAAPGGTDGERGTQEAQSRDGEVLPGAGDRKPAEEPGAAGAAEGAGPARDAAGEPEEDVDGGAGEASAAQDGDPSGERAGGKHRGTPAEEESGRAEESGEARHADRGEERKPGVAEPGVEEETGAYEVLPGDSLSDIAAERALAGGWPALYQANESVIGDNPDHILPGQSLNLDITAR
ncbi:transglycosylase family protein [Streptomyces sp. ACA25]|uniref:transglycosylase family protein n=1 Tax=Streptomyces sp. ACA25 TaxID=3022596 RepID=UPI0023076DCD|nr:transglycosylase family protein [Streptomyces sp. ACA25]MDB1087214.1 transglycosylase family protein [Streptomyces sp. ACA25]